MRNESRKSGSGRGGEKPVAEKRYGACRLLLHVIKSVTKWTLYTPAGFLFSMQLILIMGDSVPSILKASLPNSDFDLFPRWTEALIGGIVLIPCYIFLFRLVRRWLRANFPSDPKDVKDILA